MRVRAPDASAISPERASRISRSARVGQTGSPVAISSNSSLPRAS
ncbi:hypothetical protein SHIRM173S_09330 [Streptomyces hirsutus]